MDEHDVGCHRLQLHRVGLAQAGVREERAEDLLVGVGDGLPPGAADARGLDVPGVLGEKGGERGAVAVGPRLPHPVQHLADGHLVGGRDHPVLRACRHVWLPV